MVAFYNENTPVTRPGAYQRYTNVGVPPEKFTTGGIGGGVTTEPLSVNENGTYTAPTGKAYTPVSVNVPTANLQNDKTVTPTTAQQTVLPDSGYDAMEKVTVSAIPTGTAGTPTATKGAVSNHQITVTPAVQNTTGYITGGTKTGAGVTVSASELVSGSETKTANGTYDVTNLAELVVNVSGGGGGSTSIDPKSDTWQHNTYVTLTIEVDSEGNLSLTQSGGSGSTTNLHICYPQGSSTTVTKIPSIPTTPGTYEFPFTAVWQGDSSDHTLTYTVVSGGATAKNIQYNAAIGNIKATTMTDTGAAITVAKTGTYTCTWVHWAQAAGSAYSNYSSQLYVGDTSIGSAHYAPIYNNATTSNYICVENNVSLTEGQTVAVRARSQGTNNFINAGMLIIKEV